ncbi:MAG: phosphate acyltransferase PlsX [Pseudomonadota bacterium]
MGGQIVISVDAMGGDLGPAAVLDGMAKSAAKNPELRFLLHGPEAELTPLLRRRTALRAITEVRDASRVISMDQKPSQVIRQARGSSMANALDAVAAGTADVAVSCGNTGVLMALATLRLKRAAGIDRPAIAVLWPSLNPAGYNIVLDVGASVKADGDSLVQFAIMGAEYARLALSQPKPRVGLLNVGTETHKGSPELQAAHDELSQLSGSARSGLAYVGFVEGSDITGDKVDVIVTDGFTGNIALKTAEGTASLVGRFLSDAFRATPLSRIAALFAYSSLRRLHKRIDPRRVNGGVFLGLNGAVVKSHGSADATGVSAALKLAFRMGQERFAEKLATRVASGRAEGEDTREVASGARREA